MSYWMDTRSERYVEYVYFLTKAADCQNIERVQDQMAICVKYIYIYWSVFDCASTDLALVRFPLKKGTGVPENYAL